MQPYQRPLVYGVLIASLTALLWSGNFIIARAVHNEVGPVSLAFYRWLLATVLLLPFSFALLKKQWPLLRQHRVYLFFASLTGIGLFNTLVYVGAHHTSAINLTLIGTTSSPIIGILLARIFLKESLGWLRIAGLACCLAGIFYLLSMGHPENLRHLRFSSGDLWVLAAGACFAVYNTMARKKPTDLHPLVFLQVIFALGALLLLPFYLAEVRHRPPQLWTTPVIFSVAYLGVIASAVCFLLWNKAIRLMGASRTILFGNLIPVFGITASVILLHERFTRVHAISMLLVFAGIVLANIQVQSKAKRRVT